MSSLLLLVVPSTEERCLGDETRENSVPNRNGKLLVNVAILRQVAQSQDIFSLCSLSVRTEEDFALLRFQQAEYALQQRGLPTSIGSHNTEKVVWKDGEADVMQHLLLAIAGGEILDGYQWGHCAVGVRISALAVAINSSSHW